MSYQIIIQPNNKLCLWSTISDQIVLYDAEPDDIIKYHMDNELERIKAKVTDIVAQLRNHKKPYHQFTMSWGEAMEALKQAHGWEAVGEIMDNMEQNEAPPT